MRRLTRDEVDAMLAVAAESYWLSKAWVDEAWRDGTLCEPELRDLWLIWSDVPGYGSAPRS